MVGGGSVEEAPLLAPSALVRSARARLHASNAGVRVKFTGRLAAAAGKPTGNVEPAMALEDVVGEKPPTNRHVYRAVVINLEIGFGNPGGPTKQPNNRTPGKPRGGPTKVDTKAEAPNPR